MAVPEFDVVVVTTGEVDLGRCLLSIRDQSAEAAYRVTVVHNGDGVGMTGLIDRQFIVNENAGWVRAANAGLSISTAPYVVLMNDDVEVVTHDWLGCLRGHLLENPKLAAVAPWHNKGESYQITFYAVMFPQWALTEVGLLDRRFADGYGFDDVEWCLRAEDLGYETGCCPGIVVLHDGGATFGQEVRQFEHPECQKNYRLFREIRGVSDDA